MSEHEKVLEALSSMTVLELVQFVRELETTWGVDASVPTVHRPPPPVVARARTWSWPKTIGWTVVS